MNMHLLRLFLIFYALAFSVVTLPAENPSIPKKQHISTIPPLLLQYNQEADIIVVGRVKGIPSDTGAYGVATLKVENIISSVWEKRNVFQHFRPAQEGQINQVVVLQKGPRRWGTGYYPLIPNQRYLLWLKTAELSDQIRKEYDLVGPGFYEMVHGRDKRYMLAPGALHLGHFSDLLSEQRFLDYKKELGVDPESEVRSSLQDKFGWDNPQKIAEQGIFIARLMVAGQDDKDELQRLTQSQDEILSQIAHCLLEAGDKGRRFSFVEKFDWNTIKLTSGAERETFENKAVSNPAQTQAESVPAGPKIDEEPPPPKSVGTRLRE